MGEMLKTRDETWLGPVRLNRAADDEAMERVGPGTRFDSSPQLTVLNSEDANVVPLRQQRAAPLGSPVTLGGSHSGMAVRGWFVQGLLMEALVRDEAGHSAAAQHALERALELAAHDGVPSPFLVDPVPDLLERYASHTARADLIPEIYELRTGLEGAGVSTRAARPLAAAARSGIASSDGR
jgi:hypothetical protein